MHCSLLFILYPVGVQEAHRCRDRREADSGELTLWVLLKRINAEVERLLDLVVVGTDEELARTQTCISLWMKAYQSLAAACPPLQEDAAGGGK